MSRILRTYLFTIMLLGFTSILSFVCSKARAQQYTEYDLKAAYLYNFGKFVEWPSTTTYANGTDFVIGIYRNNPFGDILTKAIKDRTIKDRKIVIKRFFTPEEIKDCQILFISDITKEELVELLNYLQKKPVLTVGDDVNEFCRLGGIINLTPQFAKYRFQINNKAAGRISIVISSKLLTLSKIVTEDEVKF